MKEWLLWCVSVLLGIGLLAGCATASGNRAGTSPQQKAARAVLDYRNLAAELREMARRRDIEADVMAHQPNIDHARISHWRDMAQKLRREADAAEQHAREMQKAVPHGMVQ